MLNNNLLAPLFYIFAHERKRYDFFISLCFSILEKSIERLLTLAGVPVLNLLKEIPKSNKHLERWFDG